MSAVQNNSPSVVSYLLENGSDPFLKDIYDNNIAFYLIESFKRENLEQFNNKVTLLNTYGFEIDDTPQGGGNSLIHITAKKMDLDLVKWLMQYKLNINQKNEEGNTPLHIVAMKAKNDKILKFLIRNGANKEIKTDFNESAMDLALENELLIKNKINLNFLK
jgi:ankyrin repeat protein